MKYTNENGVEKELGFKVGDTYPIGGTTEIPDDVEVPEGWKEIPSQIKSTTVTYTTTASGSFNTGLTVKDHLVVFVKSEYNVLNFTNTDDVNIWFTIKKTTGENVAGTEVTLKIYYIEERLD